MKSMSVTKSEMALLSQEQLTQATFGALCQSFAMQILGRSSYEDGMYQRVALEFLEEETEQPQQPVQNVFNIDLNLVLETIRKEAQNQKREKKETEKLLEQVLHIQQAAEQKQTTIRHTSPVERTYLLAPQHSTVTRQSITIHNSFHHHGAAAQTAADRRRIQQAADRVEREVHTQLERPENQTQPIPGGPGSLSSRTAQFVKQVQEGRDLMQPGGAQPQVQPVIPGRKIEQPTSLQQALRPAAEMELKTEPAQLPETGKTAAETVAEAVKSAVERQLQSLQSVQAPAESNAQRISEQKEIGHPSQPDAQQKQGRLIPMQTVGPELQTPQSVTHIQQQIGTQAHTAALTDQEAAMTTAREIRVTGLQAGTVPDAPVQAPMPAQQQSVLDARTGETLHFLQKEGAATDETAQADRQLQKPAADRERAAEPAPQMKPIYQVQNTDGKTGMASTSSEEKQREQLLRTVPVLSREPLTQTLRQDIRMNGSRPKRPSVPSDATTVTSPVGSMAEYPTVPQTSEQSEPENPVTQLQHVEQVPAAEQQLQTLGQDALPVGQRDIRVTGSGLEHAVVQGQTEQAASPAIFPPAGGTEELSFRQVAEPQEAVEAQPPEVRRPMAQLRQTETAPSAVRQRMEAVEQNAQFTQNTGASAASAMKHTQDAALTVIQQKVEAASVQPHTEETRHPVTGGPHRIVAAGLTEADLKFLSERQRTQVLEAVKQGTQSLSQRDIRVAGNGLEPSLVQPLDEQAAASAEFLPVGGTEELTFRQEPGEQAASQYEKTEPAQVFNGKSSAAQVETAKTQMPAVQRPLSPAYTELLRTFSPGLTEADLQFLSEGQQVQVLEAVKQRTQTVSQRDIRVTGNSLEPPVVQEEAERPILPAAYPSVGGTEELTFRQGPEEQAAVQVGENGATQASNLQSLAALVKPSGTQETAAPMKSSQMQASAAQRPMSPAYTELIRTFVPGLTEADLQFLSEGQRTQVLEAVRQGAQPLVQRDIRVAGNGLEPSLVQPLDEQAAASAEFLPVGGAEELIFREEPEAQPLAQTANATAVQPSGTQSPVAQFQTLQTSNMQHAAAQKSIGSDRHLTSASVNLLRTVGLGMTEADMAFFTESQRTQILEAVRQGSQPIGTRDIRVTGSGPEGTAVAEPAAQLPDVWSEGLRPEELAFRQGPEPHAVAADLQMAATAQPTADKAQGIPRQDSRTHQLQQQSDRSAAASQPVIRDIRVLTEQSADRTEDRTAMLRDVSVRDMTPAELDHFMQSHQMARNETPHVRAETADRMMQTAAMEELYHLPKQSEELPVSQPVAAASATRTMPSQMRSTPTDIRILRQLSMASPIGQQSRELPESASLPQSPAPVDMQLPTGSNVGQQAAEPSSAVTENVSQSPVDLTYSPAMVLQQNQPPKDPAVPAADTKSASSYVNSLPQWAQNFVRNGSTSQTGITPPAPIVGVVRDIASLPGNSISGDTQQIMDWSAPNRPQMADQAARRPAEVVFKEKNQDEERQRQSVQMSESELRRTADKIYQIIEDRIRRERRLLGL